MSSALPGCASLERGAPVPAGRAWEATVLGLANERFYPVHDLKPLEAEFIAAVMRQALNQNYELKMLVNPEGG